MKAEGIHVTLFLAHAAVIHFSNERRLRNNNDPKVAIILKCNASILLFCIISFVFNFCRIEKHL